MKNAYAGTWYQVDGKGGGSGDEESLSRRSGGDDSRRAGQCFEEHLLVPSLAQLVVQRPSAGVAAERLEPEAWTARGVGG